MTLVASMVGSQAARFLLRAFYHITRIHTSLSSSPSSPGADSAIYLTFLEPAKPRVPSVNLWPEKSLRNELDAHARPWPDLNSLRTAALHLLHTSTAAKSSVFIPFCHGHDRFCRPYHGRSRRLDFLLSPSAGLVRKRAI